jgi:uncharacterized membrane protein YfcA
MSWWVIIFFGLVILATHFIEGITGFGCTVLALPFAIMLVGIDVAVPVLIMLSLLLCVYVVIISFKDIVWKEFLTIVMFVALGLPIGIFLFSYFEERILKIILGVFMVVVSIKGLLNVFLKKSEERKLPSWLLRFALFGGGVFHGAFSSGGPLVIIYVTRVLKNKSHFRATMCMLWVTLNTALVIQNQVRGIMTPFCWEVTLYALPFLIVGALLGNIAHHKIEDKHFTTLVYIVLLISGVFMLFSGK